MPEPEEKKFISFEVDERLLSEIDQTVQAQKSNGAETDRSKFIRTAIRKYIVAIRPTDADPDIDGVINLAIEKS